MRIVCGILATIAILICIASPLRVFFGSPTGVYEQDFATFKTIFNWATLLWFLSAPYWMVPELFSSKTKKEDE